MNANGAPVNLPRSVLIRLSVLLKRVRYGDMDVSRNAFSSVSGYLDALWDADLIPLDVKQRVDQLVLNAYLRLDRREVTADAPVEVPAPSAPRVVHLLCMRGRSIAGRPGALQPVQTLHRVPPYAGVRGDWDVRASRRCMAGGFVYLSCGTGVYLRKAPGRVPSTEAFARCLRRWLADDFRSRRAPTATEVAAA
ncbi:hypothetical protein D9M69_435300 [compost metagenome]